MTPTMNTVEPDVRAEPESACMRGSELRSGVSGPKRHKKLFRGLKQLFRTLPVRRTISGEGGQSYKYGGRSSQAGL